MGRNLIRGSQLGSASQNTVKYPKSSSTGLFDGGGLGLEMSTFEIFDLGERFEPTGVLIELGTLLRLVDLLRGSLLRPSS